MAAHFLRVDLARATSQFRPITITPGAPLLDRPGEQTHFKVLRKWLGDLVAEPRWSSRGVSYFIRTSDDRRLVDVACTPVSEHDWKRRAMQAELEKLRTLLSRLKPEADEALLAAAVRKCFEDLRTGAERGHREDVFFRYRDPAGAQRLVWAWGYARKEASPGAPQICPKCTLLFLRANDKPLVCPGCQWKPVARRLPTRALAIAALLLLAVGLGTWWSGWRPWNNLLAQAPANNPAGDIPESAPPPSATDQPSDAPALPAVTDQGLPPAEENAPPAANTEAPADPTQTASSSPDSGIPPADKLAEDANKSPAGSMTQTPSGPAALGNNDALDPTSAGGATPAEAATGALADTGNHGDRGEAGSHPLAGAGSTSGNGGSGTGGSGSGGRSPAAYSSGLSGGSAAPTRGGSAGAPLGGSAVTGRGALAAGHGIGTHAPVGAVGGVGGIASRTGRTTTVHGRTGPRGTAVHPAVGVGGPVAAVPVTSVGTAGTHTVGPIAFGGTFDHPYAIANPAYGPGVYSPGVYSPGYGPGIYAPGVHGPGTVVGGLGYGSVPAGVVRGPGWIGTRDWVTHPAGVVTDPVVAGPVVTTPAVTTPIATTPIATTPIATTPIVTTPVAGTPYITHPVASAGGTVAPVPVTAAPVPVATAPIVGTTTPLVDSTVGVNTIGAAPLGTAGENWFENVEAVHAEQAANGVQLELSVRGQSAAGNLEYRVIGPGDRTDIGWLAARQLGTQTDVVLLSPKLVPQAGDAVYRLVIEARSTATGQILDYPFAFRLVLGVKPEATANPTR